MAVRRSLLLLVTVGLLLIPTDAQAIARTVKFHCGFSHGPLAADPIVSPGVPSAHAHEFVGNRTTNQDSTFDSMVGQPTTCAFTGDTAGYWTPELLRGDGTRVPLLGMVAYYDRMSAQPVSSFPDGLGVIAGYNHATFSSNQRSYFGWVCDNRDPLRPDLSSLDCTSYSGSAHYVSARFFFPFCLTSSEVLIYPTGYPKVSACDAGTTPVPRLREVFKFDTSACTDCYLSSDMMFGVEHGASLHADFWNTWVPSALDGLVVRLNG